MRRYLYGSLIALALGCSDTGQPSASSMGVQTPNPQAAPTAGAGVAGGVSTPPAAGTAAPAPPTPTPQAGTSAPPTSPPAPGAGTGGQAGMPAGAAGTSPAGQGATAGGAPPDAGTEPPAQTCSASQSGSAGRETVRLQHAGVSREYILHVPASYSGDAPVPLVLYFHPLLTNARTAETSSGFAELADSEGFIVAFPESQESAAWNVGPCCTASRDVDDVGFARAIVDDIESRFCVDEKRVYASGFSMGGGMSHYLGCEAADVFAAVAPGAFDLLAENECNPARPITVISFRGTSDLIVPYEGGRKTSAPNGFVGVHTFEGAEGTFERWAEVNGCTGQPVDEGGGCKTHMQCAEGVEVTLCTSAGGHTWPDPDRAWQTLSRFTMP